MKKRFLIFTVAAGFMLASCGGNHDASKEEAEVTSEKEVADVEETQTKTYEVNLEESNVAWTGYKFSKYDHTGDIDIKDGSFKVKDGELVAGKFVIDMTTLREKGEGPFNDPEKVKELEDHLKNEDFFEVTAYPTSTFEITNIEPIEDSVNTHKVSGNLTIKDTTNNVTFPAKINVSDKQINAQADLRIDRSKWNVRYGSKSFFDDLGDKAISNDIDFKINIIAETTGTEM